MSSGKFRTRRRRYAIQTKIRDAHENLLACRDHCPLGLNSFFFAPTSQSCRLARAICRATSSPEPPVPSDLGGCSADFWDALELAVPAAVAEEDEGMGRCSAGCCCWSDEYPVAEVSCVGIVGVSESSCAYVISSDWDKCSCGMRVRLRRRYSSGETYIFRIGFELRDLLCKFALMLMCLNAH
jgi:hypothetical protein